MADSFSDIMSNYDSKSMEELGSSLLQKQSDDRAANNKRNKKSQRVGQALAVLGVGQKIFKNAYDKRKDELDKKGLFMMSNQDSQVKEIQQVSRLVQNLPDKQFFIDNKDLNQNELVKLYLEKNQNSLVYKQFTPVVDSFIKSSSMFTDDEMNIFKKNQSQTYKQIYNQHLHAVIGDYFEKGKDGTPKYFEFEKQMRDLFELPDSMDRLDVFKKGLNLTAHELSQSEQAWISNRKKEYSNKGFINTLKDGLEQVGLRAERKGNINAFKNINNVTMDGAGLDDVLNDLRVNGSLIGAADISLSRPMMKGVVAKNAYLSDETAQNNVEIYLNNFSNQMEKGTMNPFRADKYDSNINFQLAVDRRNDWDAFTNDINENDNPIEYNQWKEDIGVLAQIFTEDPQIAEEAYFKALDANNIDYTDEDVEQFKTNITTSAFRHSIAIAITAREGFVGAREEDDNRLLRPDSYTKIDSILEEETYDINTMDTIQKKYLYKRNKGKIPEVMGEGIVFNEKTSSYEGSDYYNEKDKDAKIRMYSFEINKIYNNTNISDTEKNMAMEHLFDTLPNPAKMTPIEFLTAFPPQILT